MDRRVLLFLAGVVVLMAGTYANATITIATFQDPAAGSATPLFTVNSAGTITGGWDAPGLDIYFPVTGVTYHNATFTLTPLTFPVFLPPRPLPGKLIAIPSGTTGAGSIKFFSQANKVSPIFEIDFQHAHLSAAVSMGSTPQISLKRTNDGVVFSGSEIVNAGLADRLSNLSFSFGFSNYDQPANNYYTVTSAFTSSASTTPEPAILALFAIGSLMLRKQKCKGH